MKLLAIGEAETEKAGFELGLKLRSSPGGSTVCLFGDLGCGKTVFTKGIGRAMGLAPRDITSASFTIIAEYESDPPFCHIDLYRLHGGEDLDALGIYEYMDSDWITAVEWADRLSAEDLEGTVRVSISFVNEDSREIIIEGHDQKSRDNKQMGAV